MDFGLAGKLGEYYLTQQYQKNVAAGKSNGVSFAEFAAAKTAGQPDVSGMSFKDMWQARYPGACYHVMDGSAISQGAWDRNDFPLEKFFQDHTDLSALNWKPTGAEPEAASSQVQSRWNSTLGQKSIIVPPELEEKMKNDPGLARRVMANVENFITTYTATSVRPGRVCSWLISLDENGEIEKYRVTGGGGNISGPTEEQQRQFEAGQAAKKKRREEYARLNEEAALKRRLMEQEADARYYKTSTAKKMVSAAEFMEIAAEKAEQDKTTDYDEKAFDMVGPNAPQDVKDAWMEAAKDVNANGLGIRGNGMMSHISQMMVQRLNKMLKGETENFDILGNTVESAIQATRQALYDLDHPLTPAYRTIEAEQARIKEREFYAAFLERLEKL